MHRNRYRNPTARKSGDSALVTDTAILTDTAAVEALGSREGDVILGLRVGLTISAALWAGMIILGLLIFG